MSVKRVRLRLVLDSGVSHLLPGNYLIGRASECDFVIDDPSVSRRHARIVVRVDGASVEDLSSVNGVYLNGERIAGSAGLKDGDSVIIGDRALGVQIHPQSTLPPERDTLPEITVPHEADRRRSAETPAPTNRANALELLGNVAERALALGQPEQAERAVQARLAGVLEVARSDSRGVEPEVAARAVSLALQLALALGARHWLDFAVELLALTSHLCSAELSADVARAARALGPPSARHVDAYTRAVAILPKTTSKADTLRLIEALRAKA